MITLYLAVVLASKHGNYIQAVIFQIINKDFRMKTRQDYAYGAYIGYADADYHFPCLNLLSFVEHLGVNAFVCDRDLTNPDAASGIMEAVLDSWRVILVVTEAFLTFDLWAEFTTKTAVFSQSPSDPARIVVVVERRLKHRLPPHLLANVCDHNVIEVSRMELGYEVKQILKAVLLRDQM